MAGRFYREKIHDLLPYDMPARKLAYSVALPWQERYIESVSLQAFERDMGLLSDEFKQNAAGAGDPLNVMRQIHLAACFTSTRRPICPVTFSQKLIV